MIETNLDNRKSRGHIVVSPNLSAQWYTTKVFIWVISVLAMLIAIGFALAGLWLILPFTGLEIIALVGLMYWVAHQCHRRQVIRFDDNHILVEKGHHQPKFAWQSEIFWTRLIVEPSPYRGHPFRLILRSKQRQLEIGEFLNEQDKKRLIGELRSIINVVD